jgi:hypothetical protein
VPKTIDFIGILSLLYEFCVCFKLPRFFDETSTKASTDRKSPGHLNAGDMERGKAKGPGRNPADRRDI